jgi:flagellar hook-length control protein FliK
MTVQSVGSFTANVNVVSGQAGKTAATDSFGKMMTSRAKEASDTTKQTASKDTENDNRISKSGQSAKANSTESANEKIPAGNDVKEQIETVQEKDPGNVKDLEKVLETLATLLNTITEILQNAFEATDEELVTGAAELGLQPSDLLNTDSLKDLFLEMSGKGAEDLIADEDLLAEFNSLSEQVNELLQEFGVEDGELFKKLATLIGTEPAKVPETPEFNEVLNAYLTAEETEPGTEETPAFKVEIEDLRGEAKPETAENAVVETEVSRADGSSEKDTQSGSHDANDTHSFVQANDFVKTLAQAAEDEAPAVQQNTFRDLYDISGQTISQIKVRLNADSSHMEIQLNPEHLGKVEINISSKNGAVTAELTAHNEAAKRALEAGLEDLKTALNDTGLKVENVEVTLAEYGFRQRDEQEQSGGRGQGRQGRRRINLDTADTGINDGFETAGEIMKEMNGGSVDYTV